MTGLILTALPVLAFLLVTNAINLVLVFLVWLWQELS